MKFASVLFASAFAFSIVPFTCSIAVAEEPATAPADAAKASDSGKVLGDPDGPLTPEEKAEKASRQACKVDLCKAFHSTDASASDIACHVVKSWRKEQLVKLVGKLKVTWPYDGAHCSTDLSVKRGDLVKAMTEPKAEVVFVKHTVTCSIASEKKGATDFSFDLTPKVTFENGKAIKAQAQWGKIEAPTLIKSALWTATAADNTVNILSGSIVEEVNEFITKRCDEVKDQWAAKQ
ncbi:hypothetical protein [Hyphomicrobium sp.]|uniref:hypothetical protein n=1 Tax=Hyphomicrobium sp. TaxID=82 RepID=UPI001D24B358|nr:hypothetical protein [Hyphomicrobium sp.]MBY0559815.1 hypothetical protein [Hyphomicrobium sp.]